MGALVLWAWAALLAVVVVGGCGGADDSPGTSASAAPSASDAATVEAGLDRVTTSLLDSLVGEDFAAAEALFDAAMRKALPTADLARTWSQVGEQVGAYQSELGRRQETSGGYDLVTVTVRFARGALDVQLAFDRDRRIAGLYFRPATGATATASPAASWQPPPYADPEATQAGVTVGTGEWALPGTLTTPAHTSTQPWPGVVLVHGSGPNDRDETVGANKPFRDLALGLAARGVAVLAYDKRSFTHGSALAQARGLTVQQEAVADAVLAVDLLRATPGVDPDRVFVLGHSLGGMLAPRIAQQAHGLAGLVIMAGAARPIEDLALEQSRYLTERDGTVTEEERAAVEALAEQVARIKDPDLAPDTPSTQLMGAPGSYWLDLRGYDPTKAAAGLDLPILVLQGERDYQVTMTDFARWKKALGGRDDVTLTSFPGLNHLMIASPTPTPTPTPTASSAAAGQGALGGPEDYQVPGHVDVAVVDAIAGFVQG
jgi:uncharacterized protein